MGKHLTVLAAMVALLALAAGRGTPGGAPVPVAPPSLSPSPLAPGVERFVIAPGESTVAYRVGETLFGQTARWRVVVGVTNAMQGEILVDRLNPRESRAETMTVDVARLKSDSARRDAALRTRWLETATYPIAEFTPTAIRGIPGVYVEDREIPVEITGTLKIRDVVRPAAFTGTLTLSGETLRGVANATIRMTDFGFDPPALLGIVKADDTVTVEVRFTAERVQ